MERLGLNAFRRASYFPRDPLLHRYHIYYHLFYSFGFVGIQGHCVQAARRREINAQNNIQKRLGISRGDFADGYVATSKHCWIRWKLLGRGSHVLIVGGNSRAAVECPLCILCSDIYVIMCDVIYFTLLRHQWIPRGTLSALLEDATLDLRWDDPLLKLAIDAARGMAYLHGREYFDERDEGYKKCILHRDLKPENALITDYISLKITDFGISRAKAADDVLMTSLGTPLFCAPETSRGDPYDEKAGRF